MIWFCHQKSFETERGYTCVIFPDCLPRLHVLYETILLFWGHYLMWIIRLRLHCSFLKLFKLYPDKKEGYLAKPSLNLVFNTKYNLKTVLNCFPHSNNPELPCKLDIVNLWHFKLTNESRYMSTRDKMHQMMNILRINTSEACWSAQSPFKVYI